MVAYPNVQVHLFHELTGQAIAGAFAGFQSATWKLGDIGSADEFITYQYLVRFIDQYTIYPNVEHAYFRIRFA